MAELTYRDAVARGIAQEMERDEDVVFLGEDVAAAGGVFKSTVGLLEKFGPVRVRDCPISEQAILGAAMGAAMTGLKPIAEIMFSDFFAVCFDYIANEFPKSRYMSNGQLKCPLVVRTANGAGSRFGAQHSQSVENWAMMIPGLKVVAPSTPRDVIGLLAAAVRDPDPVIFFEHKSLYPTKGEVPDGEIVDTLGTARIVRPGKDATILALALMVPRALEAAERLQAEAGIDCEVVDVRSLVPLDTQTILELARAHASPVHCRGEPAALRVGRGDRVHRRRRSVLRSRRSAGPDHDAASSAPRRRCSRRHDPPDRRPDCRPHSAVLELLRQRHGRTHAAARRNCRRREDHEVVQIDRRDCRARRQSLRDRNGQGHGRGAGDRRWRAHCDQCGCRHGRRCRDCHRDRGGAGKPRQRQPLPRPASLGLLLLPGRRAPSYCPSNRRAHEETSTRSVKSILLARISARRGSRTASWSLHSRDVLPPEHLCSSRM